MQHLQKLSIQGVRSYDPDIAQEIKFFPLTIIVGANGAGKTSIIESLKFATTGTLPPNCNAGKSFVHDVHYAKRATIHGQIRLMFTDIQKRTITITRKVQASVTKAGINFRQIGAAIKRDDNLIDQKKFDINSEMIELLGVSKAVLNNIIFCHQEDTNWPLSEGKALKEKFDDIFGSIGYVKVLEKIKKTRAEEVNTKNLLEKDVNIYRNLKNETDYRKSKLSEAQANLDVERRNAKELESRMQEAKLKLDEFMELERDADELTAEISQIEGSIEEKSKLANKIKSTCSERTLAKSKPEVDEELRNFDTNAATLLADKRRHEAQFATFEAEYAIAVAAKQAVATDAAKIEEYSRQIAKLSEERKILIRDISSADRNESSKSTELLKPIIDKLDTNVDLCGSDCDTVSRFIQAQIVQAQERLDREKQIAQTAEQDVKRKVDDAKAAHSGAVHERDFLSKQSTRNETEIAQIEKSITQSAVSETHLDSLTSKIAHYRAELERLDSDADRRSSEEQRIAALESAKNDSKYEIERLEKRIAAAKCDNDEKIKFDMLKAQMREKMTLIDEIKATHSELYCEIGADEAIFGAKLNDRIESIDASQRRSQTKLHELQREFHRKNSKLDAQRELLAKRQQQLCEHKAKFADICAVERFDEFATGREQELNRLRIEQVNRANIAPVIERQIATIAEQEMCPVCENDLAIGWISKRDGGECDRSRLIDRLRREQSETNPSELKRIATQLEECEKLCARLSRLRSDRDTIDEIEREIPAIKREMAAIGDEIEDLQRSIDRETMSVDVAAGKIRRLRAISLDANRYDSCCGEVAEIRRKLQQFDAGKWSSDSDQTDIERLTVELREAQIANRSADQELADSQRAILAATNEKMRLHSLLQAAERNKADYEKRDRDRLAQLERKHELSAELDEIKRKIATLDSTVRRYEPQIVSLEAELRTLRDDFTQTENNRRREIRRGEMYAEKFTNIMASIGEYSRELDDSKLKTSIDYVDQLERDVRRLEREKKSLAAKIGQMSEDIANLELRKRELLDYERYLDLIASITEQEAILSRNRARMRNMDLAAIKRSRIDHLKRYSRFDADRGAASVRMRELDDRVQALIGELRSKDYATAAEKYRKASIEKCISEMVCDDLDKYYKALDYSIASFHRRKMDEVNKLLREFWRVAYRGADIDHISIVCDEERRCASDKRRTYNYRVVMSRQGAEMDMRGRSSAGQKVLASLVIRLALAVIFCGEFAVLALDEPTTNLDHANIDAFAKAVTNLVRSYRNFQILIISHDEEFIQCLDGVTGAGDDSGKYYYRVFKNDIGYSTIVRRSVDDYYCGDSNRNPDPSLNNSLIMSRANEKDADDSEEPQRKMKKQKKESIVNEIRFERAPKRQKIANDFASTSGVSSLSATSSFAAIPSAPPAGDKNTFFGLSKFDENESD